MKRKLLGGNNSTLKNPQFFKASPTLSYQQEDQLISDDRPENKPFTIHEPVEPKPDVVKRCIQY